jgi:hypothetical protein
MQGRAKDYCRTKAGAKETGTADLYSDDTTFYEGDGKVVEKGVCLRGS